MSRMACPICKLESQEIFHHPSGDETKVKCDRCGTFIITRPALLAIASEKIGHKTIAWIKNLTEQPDDPPRITSEMLENAEKNLPNYTVTEKQLILLKNIERRMEFPGEGVSVMAKIDYPLSWAKNEKEFIYYLKSLGERGLIRFSTENRRTIDDPIQIVDITAAGWDFLEKNARTAAISDQAFVAMSFSSELKAIWENGIKRAIERAGYVAYRVDSEPHVDRIDVKIMAEIKNSRFLIADVTEQKMGVYFEAGYGLGLGIPVLWSCRRDDLTNAHFDTNHYNHILWENETGLEEELYDFICAIIGKGPRKPKT
jgi:nucleoside 2-deoxyribosyltransferase